MVRPSKVGVVVSQGKMDKTVKVRIRKVNWNKTVSKYIVSHRNMLVHDELNKCREGDVVRIQYVRPLSALKSWAVAAFIKLQGTSWEKYKAEIPGEVRADELAKLKDLTQRRSVRQQAVESGQVTPASELDVDRLENQVSRLSDQLSGLSFMSAEAKRIVSEEPERANEIISKMGRDPASLSPNIKRNIVLKHLRQV